MMYANISIAITVPLGNYTLELSRKIDSDMTDAGETSHRRLIRRETNRYRIIAVHGIGADYRVLSTEQ